MVRRAESFGTQWCFWGYSYWSWLIVELQWLVEYVDRRVETEVFGLLGRIRDNVIIVGEVNRQVALES